MNFMGTPSVNSLSDYRLINFNVPKYLINNFDNLVKFKRVSRTSMLIHLMENYIRTEKKQMEVDNTLNLMINDITVRNKNDLKKEMMDLKNEIGSEFEPPMIPFSNDDLQNDDWNDVSGVGWLKEL